MAQQTELNLPPVPPPPEPVKDDFDEPAGGHLNPNYFTKDAKLIAAAVFAEFIGTLFLVLVAVGVQANEIKFHNDIAADNASLKFSTDYTLTVALAYGLTYTVLHSTFEKVSGAHFNPAITMAAVVSRREKILPGVALIVSQLIGSVCGAAIYDAMSGSDDYGELGTPKVDTHFDLGSIFGVELMSVLFISLVWFLHVDLRRRPIGRFRDDTGPIYVGFAYAVASALTSRWDRVALNPARAFGPAAIAGDWGDHWVFWIGPLFGGMSGALLFEMLVWLSGGERAKRLTSWY